MKPLFAFALTALLASSVTALAAPDPAPRRGISCHSTGVADAGFTLRVEPSQRRALLSQITFAGTRPIAQLFCNPVLQGRPRPDVPRNFLLCTGFAQGFGNVAVRVYTPGFGGFETARVLRVTRFGFRRVEREVRFGNLICGR